MATVLICGFWQPTCDRFRTMWCTICMTLSCYITQGVTEDECAGSQGDDQTRQKDEKTSSQSSLSLSFSFSLSLSLSLSHCLSLSLSLSVPLSLPPSFLLLLKTVRTHSHTHTHTHTHSLQAFVHVSSAYAHCNRKDQIEEIIYPPKIHPDKVLALLE